MLFEIHITVKSDDIERFKKDCYNINIKPILIDTIKDTSQLMSSSKHNEDDYIKTCNTIVEYFNNLDYEILRKKVEKFPNNKKDENFIYYESHIRLKLPKLFNKTNLINKCETLNFHISNNLFKTSKEYDYQMITYRNKK